MKKFLLDYTTFRLVNPVFNGAMVYLLILLVNNNVEQLQVSFFSHELFICFFLSYMAQEILRFEIGFFNKRRYLKSSLVYMLLQVFIALIVCIMLVSISISIYYEFIFGFMPSIYEFVLFNSAFSLITLSYILLFIGAKHLENSHTIKLQIELVKNESIKNNYLKFKQSINPSLLITSLETLISLVRRKDRKAHDLINNLASLYRYPLINKSRQLILFSNELNACFELLGLINLTPSRNITIKSKVSTKDFLVVPGSLLLVIQKIISRTIHDEKSNLSIEVNDSDSKIYLKYLTNDRLNKKLTINDLNDIEEVYSIYSSNKICVTEDNGYRSIEIPKLITVN